MTDRCTVRVAIVDYGMGNLHSIKLACAHVGMQATITSMRQEIIRADIVVLPGVGAFGDAMKSLKTLDLISPLIDIALSGRPFIGICLGMQLLMSESYEFGRHRGLGIIEGEVVRLPDAHEFDSGSEGGPPRRLKIPHIGWDSIFSSLNNQHQNSCDNEAPEAWSHTPLMGLHNGECLYFAHSLFVRPADSSVVLSVSRYGNIEYCSSLMRRNIFACQFHPERSGPKGLQIYRNLVGLIKNSNPVG